MGELVNFLKRFGRNAEHLAKSSEHFPGLVKLLPKIGREGAAISSAERVTIARAFDEFRVALAQDGHLDVRDQRTQFMRMVSNELPSSQSKRAFIREWAAGTAELDARASSGARRTAKAAGTEAPQPAKFANFRADEKVQGIVESELAQFKGQRLFDMEPKEFRDEFKKMERSLRDHDMIARQSDLGRAAYRSGQDVANALRDGKKVSQDEVNLLQRMHARRLDTHIEGLKAPGADGPAPSQPTPSGMMGGSRAESPATKAALADHEKFKGWAADRLGVFGEANKLFEAGSSQILVQNFSKLDEMLGAFSIKQMGNPGAAKLDSLGNLQNPEVLFASMIPDVNTKPLGDAMGLAPTSKADPSSVNGKILSYYDNEGNPLSPLIEGERATPNDVNRILQQLLSYKPGVEVHVHPADWEKVRGAVYERRFNELSDKLAGGQRLDASPGTSVAGKESSKSQLDDYIEAARITGRVEAGSTAASGRNISDIVAGARGANGKISESDISAIQRSHAAARAVENNPTSNQVREIIDTLKPQTKEVTEVQTEMGNLRRNVRAAGMLDTTPVDPDAPVRGINEISEALRNGEQVKTTELDRYVSKQIGDSLLSSQQSLVATLQAGFNSNKRMDTEQIFTQLERIRKDPDYPLRNSDVDARTSKASPKDINQRLFNSDPISDGELTVLRSFYKRHFDAASAPAENAAGGGMGIRALELARSITDGIKDAKSVPAGSISRATHYNTGVVIPSVRRTVMYTALPVAFAGAVGQAALDPEEPNFIGRASINFIQPDGNPNASDFAEFTYGRMNANTEMARGYFNEYLGLPLPKEATEGQANTPENKSFYTNAIDRIRREQFVKEPTTDLRQALMMYASAKATGVASASSAEVQTQLNANVKAEAEKSDADFAKAEADASLAAPTDTRFNLYGSSPVASEPDLSQSFKNASQFENYLSSNNALLGLDQNQQSEISKAWKEVAQDGRIESKDRPALEARLKAIPRLDSQQIQMVAEVAMSPPSM